MSKSLWYVTLAESEHLLKGLVLKLKPREQVEAERAVRKSKQTKPKRRKNRTP